MSGAAARTGDLKKRKVINYNKKKWWEWLLKITQKQHRPRQR